MIVKDNQPKLLDDVKTVFHGPFSHLLEKSSSQTLDLGHGRIEERSLTASAELPGYSDLPGLEQVFQLTRKAIITKTEKVWEETVYGVTSLTTQQADPERLLGIVRSHWHIENRSHIGFVTLPLVKTILRFVLGLSHRSWRQYAT
jgi:hypothetical protein